MAKAKAAAKAPKLLKGAAAKKSNLAFAKKFRARANAEDRFNDEASGDNDSGATPGSGA